MLTKRVKAKQVKSAQRHDTDTGSPEVQISIITRRIEELSTHLDKNKKDKHSRRGLLGLVAQRRAHLKYLETNNRRAYGKITKALGIKK